MERLLFIENGLQKAKGAFREIKTFTNARDFNFSDSNRSLVYNSTTNVTLNLTTIPDTTNTSQRWEIGTEIELIQMDTGSISVSKGVNVDIVVYNDAVLTLLGKGAVMMLKLMSQTELNDTWLATGYL
jgi:hypothetical protein